MTDSPFRMHLSVDVTKDDGMFVGVVKELPIVIQAQNKTRLKTQVKEAIHLYALHHTSELVDKLQIKLEPKVGQTQV